MRVDKKIIGLIPARLGSVRVKCKNLRMINNHPLIYYTIQQLKSSRRFDEIYVNSESELIGELARRYGINFYQRPEKYALSSSMIDEYIYDFLIHVECDVLAVINPTSPFLTAAEMDRAINQFLTSDCDTQLCCERVQTHCFLDGTAENFSTDGQHPRSQDLVPILALNFAITIWNAKKFIRQFEKKGHGVYTGKLGFYITEGFSNIDIDYEEDFQLAAVLMQHMSDIKKENPAEYDPVWAPIIEKGVKTER